MAYETVRGKNGEERGGERERWQEVRAARPDSSCGGVRVPGGLSDGFLHADEAPEAENRHKLMVPFVVADL